MERTPRENSIEKIKTGVIAVLFVCMVLLLCFFWLNISVKDIKNFSIDSLTSGEVENGYMPDAKALFVPSKLVITDGTGGYRLFNAEDVDCWTTEERTGMVDLLAASLNTKPFFLEEITEKQYNEIMDALSITAIFDYELHFADLCTLVAGKAPTETDSVGAISSLGFSAASAESIFVKDDEGKYYRLLLPESGEFLSSYIKTLSQSEDELYFSIDTYLGESASNGTLVPTELNAELKDFAIKRDFDIKNHEEINRLAKRFFSESFDFVREIEEESGRTVYMYGYGQRILIADVDGTLEYKRQANENASSVSFLQAFETARTFIKAQGGFATLSGYRLQPYIRSTEYNFDDNGGSRFVFGLKCGDYPLLSVDNDALTIEVSKGQVTYFKRSFVSFDAESAIARPAEAMDAINVIAKNYNEIYNIMIRNNLVKEAAFDADAEFNVVTDTITDIAYGYVYDGDNIARSAWLITCANGRLDVYFSLYNGEFLAYRVK